ncbi:MAG TPA: hypothetical protein VN426_01950 [Syntrophomonadaceae bacterium]|nr:hypothetical protein [Syntrophomonadaceae bacterium]
MKSSNTKKINGMVIFSAAAVLIACMFAGKTPLDGDPIWSSAVGHWIYYHHAVPQFDSFSWTVAGKPWLNHEWLFCLIAYITRSHFGDIGFLLLAALNIFLLAGLLTMWINKLNPSRAASILCALGMIMLSRYISPRAYLITYPLFLLLLYLLHFHAKDKHLYWAPLIIILWVNFHSTAIYGVGMLVVESIYRTITKKEEASRFWFITGLSVLATLVNPYGYRIWVYIAQFSFNPLNHYVNEFKAPDFSDFLLLGSYIIILSIAILFFIRFAQKGLKYEESDVMYPFWFIAFYLYSLTSVRGGAYTIIFWLIMSMYYFKRLYDSDFSFIFQIAMVSVLLITVLIIFPKKPVVLYSPTQWPLAAIEYLEKHPKNQDHLYNQHVFGALLIDKGIKPFIDARGDVYVLPGVFQDVVNTEKLIKPPTVTFQKYGIKNIFIKGGTLLDIYMQGRPGWKEIYRDQVAVIYEINT